MKKWLNSFLIILVISPIIFYALQIYNYHIDDLIMQRKFEDDYKRMRCVPVEALFGLLMIIGTVTFSVWILILKYMLKPDKISGVEIQIWIIGIIIILPFIFIDIVSVIVSVHKTIELFSINI